MPGIVLTSSIFPPDIGGPATYVPKIAQALCEEGWQVSVFTLSNDCNADDSHRPYTVVREPRDVPPLARRLRSIRKITELAQHADLIYANGIVLESAIAAKFSKKPMLQKFVGDVVWEGAHRNGQTSFSLDEFMASRMSLKLEAKKSIRNWWLRQGTNVVVPSQYLANLLISFCGVPQDRIRVIYNGVSMPKTHTKHALPDPSNFKIVTSSRLVRHKCVDGILRACGMFANAELTIIGDGPERENLEAMASQSPIRVTFTGQLPRDAALNIMSQHDVFVLNSVYEGLPHVAIEAMSLGLPVIGSAAGGTPEVVHDGLNGFLVPCHDDAAIFSALRSLSSNPELYVQCVRHAHATAERFTDENMLRQTTALLNAIATSVALSK